MSASDTTGIAGDASFPSTCWEDLCRASDEKAPGFREALNSLCSAYWVPVYGYIRRAWGKTNEDAKDLTQEFFATIFDAEFLARCNPDRGTFRAFVLTSLRNFLSNEDKARRRIKRGGGQSPVSIEAMEPGADPASPDESPEQYFERAWARGVLDRAVETLRRRLTAQGRSECFEAFRRYCLEPEPGTTYREIAGALGKTAKEIDNLIYSARREFRSAVVDTVREYVADPNLVAEELERLFGRAP